MIRYNLIVLFLIASIIFSYGVQADVSAEREVLARLLHELQVLETLIDKAEVQREKESRIQFRYDWLRQDIARIKTGIQAHLNAPRTEPRTFPPLRGDYRR